MNQWKWMFKIYLFSFLGLGSVWLYAQSPMIYYPQIKGASSFYYDMATLATEDSNATRIRVYSKIAYDDLQFVKKEDHFLAKYELSITLFDERGNQIAGDIDNYEVTVPDFGLTNSRRLFSYAEKEFTAPPAEYELLISMMDHDSKQTRHWKGKVTLPTYWNKGLNMSTLILADSVQTDGNGNVHVAVPNVIGNFENEDDAIMAWFEIYSKNQADSIKVSYRVLDLDEKAVVDQHYWKRLSGRVTPEVIRIERNQLKSGRYVFEMMLGEGDNAIKQSKKISIHWMGMPSFATNMDDAIQQIKYIARGKDVDTIEKAEDKQEAFQKFWKEKDPSPNTEENELMEEYYRRVSHANQHFSSMMDGWKTDRGMVYIILGGPDDIERHPFEPDSKPYIVWYYYQLNREFVFVDHTGFGDYRLLRPFWEVMGRMP